MRDLSNKTLEEILSEAESRVGALRDLKAVASEGGRILKYGPHGFRVEGKPWLKVMSDLQRAGWSFNMKRRGSGLHGEVSRQGVSFFVTQSNGDIVFSDGEL